jgi:hypothetical protein
MAACAVMVTGLVILTPLVLVGWIAAPHAGLGLPGVLRTATGLWLAAHHVGFALRGAGRIGMLPLGLVLIPGSLLWRAGRWVARTGQLTRPSEVGYAALALAAPYAVLCGALALASRSRLATPSLPQAVVAGFLIALCAGGLGAARRWRRDRLARLLPPRPAVVLGTAGSLAVLPRRARPGQFLARRPPARVRFPNEAPGGCRVRAARWPSSPTCPTPDLGGVLHAGAGFALSTVVVRRCGAGAAAHVPMPAAMPSGAHASLPGCVGGHAVVPYLAGGFGGVLLVRAAPSPAAEIAPLWGFACGAATGVLTGVLAAFSGGPLGSGRLAVVGPSGWQAGLVATLEVGVASAVAAGVANWLRLRREPGLAEALAAPGGPAPGGPAPSGTAPTHDGSGTGRDDDGGDGHRIFVDPWADDDEAWHDTERRAAPGPSELP